MGELTLFDKIKEVIGKVSFKIFLWSINLNQEQYFNRVYNEEAKYEGDLEELK